MAERKYELIMNYIKNEIYNGTFSAGQKIYSESKLMNKFNVSRHTVREALSKLAQEGVINTVHGKGSFVLWEEPQVALTNQMNNTIMVMVSYLNNHTIPDIIQKIEKKCSENGYNMILKCTHNKIYVEKECLKSALEEKVCGIIAEPAKTALPSPNKTMYNLLRERGVPIVFIHGCFDTEKDDYVIVNDVRAGYDACMKLIEAGHKHISAVFKSDDIQGHMRYLGMMKALYENQINIDEDDILWLSTSDEKVILNHNKFKEKFFERLLNTSATVCYNDDMAIAVADTLFGLKVAIPEEHSIVSFDDTQYGSAYRVPISSMGHPYGKIGELAFEGLLKKIQQPESEFREMLNVEFVPKNSIKKIL